MRLLLAFPIALALLAPAVASAEPRLSLSAKTTRPGDPVLVTVTGVDHAPKGTAGRVSLVFFPVRKGYQALFAVPIDDAPAELDINITDPGLKTSIAVKPRVWAEEKVDVAPELAEPAADKRKIIDADNAAVIDALKDPSPPRWKGKFGRPGVGRFTSPYGSWRTFNGDYRSRHLGLDIGARKGSPVKAIQDGKVSLVRDGFLMGQTVVVTHGAGVASTYFHLDDIKVAVGDEIKRGKVIGKVGMSGRTTGPHIHLGVWVPGGFIDPATFLKLRIGPPVVPPAPKQPSTAKR